MSDTNPIAPRVAAVVLAAGMSSRMGSNKMLADIHGEPLVRRVVKIALSSRARPVLVVTGHDHELVRAVLGDTGATIVHNPAYREGLSTSLRTGIRAVGDCDAALILLGDMPAISPALIDRMVAAFDPASDRVICVASFNGRRGNPVLFDRRFFPELGMISGDIGGRNLVGWHRELACEIEAGDDAPMIDLDTQEDLKRFLRRP